MIMSLPKTSTSLTELESQFDALMSNETVFKSSKQIDQCNHQQLQKKNPQNQQHNQKLIDSYHSIQLNSSQPSNHQENHKLHEMPVFQRQENPQKIHQSNKISKKTFNKTNAENNFQSLFKKKTTGIQNIYEGLNQNQKDTKYTHKSKSYIPSKQVKINSSQSYQNNLLTDDFILKYEQQESNIQQKIIRKSILLERLKNIHLFYKVNIHQQVRKRQKNDQILIQMLQQHQKFHSLKVKSLEEQIRNQKMNKNVVNKQKQLIQIQKLKKIYQKEKQKQLQINRDLQNQRDQRMKRILQKQRYLYKIRVEKKAYQNQVEGHKIQKEKLQKWKNEIGSFMMKGHQQIEKLKKFYDKEDEHIDWKRSF